jgi:hypothetical protein
MASRKHTGRKRTRRQFEPGRMPALPSTARPVEPADGDEAAEALTRLRAALDVLEQAIAALERRS